MHNRYADSFMKRIFVYALAAVAVLFSCHTDKYWKFNL